jgi:hypothetical protein
MVGFFVLFVAKNSGLRVVAACWRSRLRREESDDGVQTNKIRSRPQARRVGPAASEILKVKT